MYPSVAQGSYENCCLKYAYVKNVMALRRHIVNYRVQETDGGCNIPAVVFKLTKSRTVCADPRLSWVQKIVQKLDKNSANM
ncbi:hypothetical protein QQF64_003500 [Cirrhinus molitorella]